MELAWKIARRSRGWLGTWRVGLAFVREHEYGKGRPCGGLSDVCCWWTVRAGVVQKVCRCTMHGVGARDVFASCMPTFWVRWSKLTGAWACEGAPGIELGVADCNLCELVRDLGMLAACAREEGRSGACLLLVLVCVWADWLYSELGRPRLAQLGLLWALNWAAMMGFEPNNNKTKVECDKKM